jgi:hypothetical protein
MTWEEYLSTGKFPPTSKSASWSSHMIPQKKQQFVQLQMAELVMRNQILINNEKLRKIYSSQSILLTEAILEKKRVEALQKNQNQNGKPKLKTKTPEKIDVEVES